MSLHGYYVGEFEYHLIRFIVDHLRDDSLVLDIGAHHGEFAVPLAYEMKTRQWLSKVWSFEPDPENFRSLQDNLSINDLCAHAELSGRQQRQYPCGQRGLRHRERGTAHSQAGTRQNRASR
jgi:FkbM family methyltransferase